MARALPSGYSSRVDLNASLSLVGAQRCSQIILSADPCIVRHKSYVGAQLLGDQNHVEDRRGARRKAAKVA